MRDEAMNDVEAPAKRRADAERNHGRILDAARGAFAERGLDTSLEDVAGRAGVGIGTIYRHFPTRDDLISACFESRLDEYARAAEEALREPDAWTGFRQFVERTCEMQAGDRGLKDVLTRTFPRAGRLEAHRARGFELMLRLIDRAKAVGALRPDFVPEDYVLLLMGNAGVLQGMAEEAPDAWRRYLAIMLDGLRAHGEPTALPAPPTPRQVLRATLRLSRSSRRPSGDAAQ